MNVAVQALLADPSVRSDVANSTAQGPLTAFLKAAILQPPFALVDPSDLWKIREVSTTFADGDPGDASEAFLDLINILHAEQLPISPQGIAFAANVTITKQQMQDASRTCTSPNKCRVEAQSFIKATALSTGTSPTATNYQFYGTQ